MTDPLPRYATKPFVHFDRTVKRGDALDADDELVVLRPDLFTTRPPRARTPKPTKSTTKEASK